jgi:hypothetical protein
VRQRIGDQLGDLEIEGRAAHQHHERDIANVAGRADLAQRAQGVGDKDASLALRRMARTFSSGRSPGSGTSSSGFTTQTRANTAGGKADGKNCTLPSSWRR